MAPKILPFFGKKRAGNGKEEIGADPTPFVPTIRVDQNNTPNTEIAQAPPPVSYKNQDEQVILSRGDSANNIQAMKEKVM